MLLLKKNPRNCDEATSGGVFDLEQFPAYVGLIDIFEYQRLYKFCCNCSNKQGRYIFKLGNLQMSIMFILVLGQSMWQFDPTMLFSCVHCALLYIHMII